MNPNTRKSLHRLSGYVAAVLLTAAFVPVFVTKDTGFRGTPLLVLLLTLFFVSLAVWIATSDMIAHRWYGHGLSVSYEHVPSWVAAVVTRTGPSLTSAAITFTAPFFVTERVEHGKPTKGTRSFDRETGVGTWDERGVEITGGGTITRLEFRVGVIPVGTNPICLSVYEDLVGRKVEFPHDLVVVPPPVDEERRLDALEGMFTLLDHNRAVLRRSIAAGSWWQPEESWLHSVSPSIFKRLDVDGRDSRCVATVETAFAEVDRIKLIAERASHPTIQDSHQAEGALASILAGLVAIKKAQE